MFNIYERDYGVTLEADRDLNTPKIENKTEAKLLRGMTADKVDLLKKIDEQKRTIEQQEEEIENQNQIISGLTEQIEQLPTLIQNYLEEYVNNLSVKELNFYWEDTGATGNPITKYVSTGINRSKIKSVTVVSNHPKGNASIGTISTSGQVEVVIDVLQAGVGATGNIIVLYEE